MTLTDTRPLPPVPTFPFSIFDPVHLGIDEYGEHVHVNLAERNMLLGGEPGGGKSTALNLIVAHGALSRDCKLILIDGKQVELGLWRHCADMFIGPSITDAIDAFEAFQDIMNDRYDKLLAAGRRKITRDDGEHVYLVVIDEYAYFSATVGTKQRPGEVRRADPRPGRPRPRRRGHHHPGHPAALPPGHRPVHAGPVRLPVGLPLHHRLLLRHRARPGLGHRRLHRRRHRPPRPRRRLAAVRDRHPPPDQGRLPRRRHHQVPGRLRRPAPPRDRRMSPAHALNGHASPPHPARPGRPDTVKNPLTPKRAGRVRENDEYAAFARRVLRAYARRVATGDVEALTLMTDLADEIDAAIGQAVTGLRGFGYSWAEIGSRLGVTRQAAQQRWGRIS